MKDLNGLNIEEVMLEAERLLEERNQLQDLADRLKEENEALSEQAGVQEKQIVLLTGYAETLNRENCEEGVKKLKDKISSLKGTIEEKQSLIDRQQREIEEKERENWQVRRSAARAEADRDKAKREQEHADIMRGIAEKNLEKKPLTVEKTVYVEKAACKSCIREELYRYHDQLEDKRIRRWETNVMIILAMIVSSVSCLISGLVHSRTLWKDLGAAGGVIYGVFPAGWFGWIKGLLLILASLVLMMITVLVHGIQLWCWKDDVVFLLLTAVLISFSDEIRGVIHLNMALLLLLFLMIFILVKICYAVVRRGR